MTPPAGPIPVLGELTSGDVAMFLLVMVLMIGLGMVLFLFSRYRRCPANRILVIYGKTGQGSPRCLHGGAAFIWPMLQAYDYLSLDPMLVPLEVASTASADGSRVMVQATLTAAISTEPAMMQNAAVRLLAGGARQTAELVRQAGLSAIRQAAAKMTDKQLGVGHVELAAGIREAAAGPLAELGIAVINVNVDDIRLAGAAG
jgi:flotillin